MPLDELKRRVNETLTDEMQIIDAYYPDMKLVELKWLGYRIEISSDGIAEGVECEVRKLFDEDSLPVMKKGKSGIREVDIKPLIKSAAVEYSGGKLIIDCILSADSAEFLNPENIIKLLRERLGITAETNLLSWSYSIMRNSAYRADMSEFR